ncbi:NfeD family protein [Chloroflexota bacterium]
MCNIDSIKSIRGTLTDWGKVLVLLLDEAVVVVLVIVVLKVFAIRIPLPVTIALALVFGILVFIIHKAVIPSLHWKPISGLEVIVGARGKVVEPLTPVGTVMVKGELWRAKSIDDGIGVNEDVEIVGLNRLTLEVKRKEQLSHPRNPCT